VAPWTELPLYAGEDARGLNEISIGRALSAGLRLRPLGETCNDTAHWATGLSLPDGIGLAPGREAELLGAWQRQLSARVLQRGSGPY
jgi:2'-hydroxyisoflavone reductase